MKDIYQFVQNYTPYNEQEEKDKNLIFTAAINRQYPIKKKSCGSSDRIGLDC